MVEAGTEVIRARDPGLAAALDVSPPPVDPYESMSHVSVVATSAGGRGIAYLAARKVYRRLKSVKFLQSILARVRHEILIRS